MTSVRPYRDGDRDAVAALVDAAFGDRGATVVRMTEALAPVVERALVAEAGSGPVGYVALSRGRLDARPRLVDVLVLSPLAVLPERQGAGIGTALVAAAVAAAAGTGAAALFLEGDPRFYGARGFVPAGPLGFGRPSVRIPAAGWQVALLPAHEPWMRGAVVYPDAFWATDTVGLRDPLLARMEG